MEKRQELSEKQEEFCRLLAEGKTTGEAERLIGFSKGYGWRLMRKEHIRRAIKVRKNPSAADAEETQKGVQQTEQPRKGETAKKAEILSFLTEVMRDEEEADLKTRMKAAELLGKRESLFEKKTPTEKMRRTGRFRSRTSRIGLMYRKGMWAAVPPMWKNREKTQ